MNFQDHERDKLWRYCYVTKILHLQRKLLPSPFPTQTFTNCIGKSLGIGLGR